MRSLDEWHKYVDIQVKRVSSAKSGQPAGPVSDHEIEGEEDLIARDNGYHALDDFYSEGDYGTVSLLPAQDTSSHIIDDPLPEALRSTPLPSMIEFAPDDLSVRSSPPAENLSQVFEASVEHQKTARNGKSCSESPRKETREELLARLLDPELTLEEAAQVLNVCPTTVRRYTNRGVLPHYRTIGNQRRFRLSHVLAFLESQEAPRSQGSGDGRRNGS